MGTTQTKIRRRNLKTDKAKVEREQNVQYQLKQKQQIQKYDTMATPNTKTSLI